MHSLITLESRFLSPDNLIGIILAIVIIGIAYSLTEKIQRFFLKIYKIIKKIVGFILKPLDALWDIIYAKGLEVVHKILPPSTNPKFDKYGGRGTFIFVITITALSPILIIIGLFFMPNNNDFFESVFLGMPPFNIIMLGLEGFGSVFKISELLLLVVLNAITLIFLKNQDECSKGLQIYYCMIFMIFGSCLAYFLSPIFSNPAVVEFFDIQNIYKIFIEEKSEKFVLTRILYIISFIPILYAFIATVGCAVRDFFGLLAYSLKPLVTFFTVITLITTTMDQNNIWVIPLFAVSMCFTAFWAQQNISFEKDLFTGK